MRKTMTMKNEIKAFIIAGLIILVVWGLYINLIYWGSLDNSMDSERKFCNFPPVAATKNCHNGVSTNFGGGLI